MQKIIIFDGVCGLCNKSIDLLLKLDKKRVFKYTSLQGNYVKKLTIDRALDTIIFYEDGRAYYKSTAILKIGKSLGGVWRISSIFYLIPEFLRDELYDIVARNRYKIFAKKEECRRVNEAEKALFIP